MVLEKFELLEMVAHPNFCKVYSKYLRIQPSQYWFLLCLFQIDGHELKNRFKGKYHSSMKQPDEHTVPSPMLHSCSA